MRPMSRTLRTPEDVALMADYVAALPPVPAATRIAGDAARGKTLFTPCVECHGADAHGNRDKNAPALNRASDWYLVAQLGKFKAGIRGTHPQDLTLQLAEESLERVERIAEAGRASSAAGRVDALRAIVGEYLGPHGAEGLLQRDLAALLGMRIETVSRARRASAELQRSRTGC